MFILSQMENAEIGTHLPLAMILEGQLDIDKVQNVFEEIVKRHEGLRTSFVIEDNEILQQIHNESLLKVEVINGREEDLDQIIKDFIKPFNLFEAPLMHVCIVNLSQDKYALLLDISHAIADGYSGSIIAREFMMLYEGRTLPHIGAQYKEYLEWMKQYRNKDVYKRKQEFWKQKLPVEMKLLDLPLDAPRPEVNHLKGKTVHSRIDESFTKQIKQFAKDTGNSLYMVLLAAFNILIAKLTGEEEVIVGTPVVVRNEEVFENTVGMFTNTMILDNKVSHKDSALDFMKQLKLNCAMSFENSEYLFEDLIGDLNYPTPVNRNPIFDIMFVYENAEDRVVALEGLKYSPYDIELNMALFDLNFEIIEERKGLTLNLYYNCELFKEDSIRSWIDYFYEILNQLMLDANQRIENILHSEEQVLAQGINRAKTYAIVAQDKEKTEMSYIADEVQGVNEVDSLEVRALEKKLSDIWAEVLGNADINVHANFFEMGVRSINALQLAERLKQEYQVNIMDLFKYATIHDLANHILGKEDKKVRVKPAKKRDFPCQDIAIIGMAGRFPGAKDIPTFWDNLVQGKEGISFFSDEELMAYGIDEETLSQSNYVKAKGVLEDVEYFDSFFFDYSPNEADKMDPQIRIFHEYAWKALEDAGYVPSTYKGTIGVFAGNASNYNWMSQIFKPNNNIEERLEKIALNDKDYMSTRISYKLNLSGPSYGIQTACSTSLTSVHLACNAILLGECDIALAGGVTIMLPKKTGYYYQEGMILSADGHCRVFDKDATGTIFGDGVGIVVLKRLDKALQDGDNIYATIKGSAVNNDANRRVGYTAPSIEGQSEVIRMACENAQVDPETITYVEAHGTGTVLGDPIEVEGLKMAFNTDKRQYCAIGSVKSNIGHLDAAAGVAGLIKTALALKHKLIPPTLHFKKANPKIDFDNSPFFVNTELMQWNRLKENNVEIPRRAGISSFGFGGTNAHVILEEAPSKAVILKPKRQDQIIVLSTKTQSALERSTVNLMKYIENNPQVNLEDLSCTLQLGREAFRCRRFINVKDLDELKETLQICSTNGKTKKAFTHFNKDGTKKVVFMFPGQGSQYVNMAKELYEKEPVFIQELDRCFTLLKEIGYKIDLKKYLFATDNVEEAKEVLKQTEVTQVVVFSIEYALAKLLMSLGVQPNAMIGHSLGEYVVACVAGVYSVEDGLKLVVERAKLMQGMEKGVMLALSLPEVKVRELINEEISIATVNGKENCVVAGAQSVMQTFEEKLNTMDIEYRKLQTSHAFHSKMMVPILEEFRVVLSKMKFSAPRIPYISNLTGDWINEKEVQTPQYWLDHLRNTVRFDDGLTKLLGEQGIFIEVGPGKTLSSLMKRHDLKNDGHYILNMLRHEKENISDITHFTNVVGTLWCLGVDIDWQAYEHNRPYNKISLPTYPFLGQKYSLDKANFGQENLNEAKGKLAFEKWFNKPYWCIEESDEEIAKEDSRQWLVFAAGNKVSNALVHKLQKAKQNVTVVKIGNKFKQGKDEFVIEPRDKEQFVSIFNVLSDKACLPTDIVYLWGLEKTSQEDIKESLVFYSLIYLSQAINQYISEKQVNIFVVSNQVYAINQEQEIDYRDALLIGPCQVIAKENENIYCKQIDINCEANSVNNIYQELFNGKQECVAYRNDLRFVKGYTSMAYEEPERDKIETLKEKGVYVITGGMGGIGLVIGEYLVKTYAAKVVLVGRSAFLQEDQWDEWLNTHEKDDLTSERIRKIQEMQTYEGQVLIECADVSDYDQMLQVVERVERRFGKITGVIHTAGIQGEGMMQFKTYEMAQKVLKPKVEGTLVIDKIFAKRQLELLVICSSMAAIIGEVGQVDYVAANSFIDCYVNHIKHKGVYKQVLSVNWDNWEKVGMAAKALAHINHTIVHMLNVGIKPQDGIKALEYALASKEPQVVVSVKDIEEQKKISNQGLNVDRLNEYLGGDHNQQYARPELSNEYVAPTNSIEKDIAEIWQQIFSMDKIGIYDDFNELGGDSLYALSIGAAMKKKFNVDITDIFNYPTIYQLAQKFSGNNEDLSQSFNKAKEALPDYFNTQRIKEDISESFVEYQKQNERYKMVDMSVENNYQAILLTGSTGYLGIYLLHELLMQTDANIYTIVRGKDGIDGSQRLINKYIDYFGDKSMPNFKERVHILEGDVTKAQFNLEDEVYNTLAKQIDCIINATGKVDHYGKYEAFNSINVESVAHIIKFASEGNKKDIHHMSTKGVGVGKLEGKQNVLFTEDDINNNKQITNYYSKTKIQAERLLLDAREKGINTSLYRIGDIVFDSHNGRFQENIDKNAVYLLVKAMINLEYIPDIATEFMDLTFVDFVSKAIVKLITRKELTNEIYHLYNPHKVGFNEWQQAFESCGYKKQAIHLNEFMDYLYNHFDDAKLKESIQDFITHSHFLEAADYTNFVLAEDRTSYLLAQCGLVWQKPTQKQLGMMLAYGKEKGFFK